MTILMFEIVYVYSLNNEFVRKGHWTDNKQRTLLYSNIVYCTVLMQKPGNIVQYWCSGGKQVRLKLHLIMRGQM